MIKRNRFLIIIIFVFLVLSGLTYFAHYIIFGDVHHIFIYLVGDLGFLPLEVLLVVVIIERILTRREKQLKLQKLNMVVGAFFSEVGNDLLGRLLDHFDNKREITHRLNVTANWMKKDFRRAADFAYNLPIEVDCHKMELTKLREFLRQKREFILMLLENPNLLEHDTFTDLLWAATHLSEELEARKSLMDLPVNDLEHLAGDMRRLYDHLASEWLHYIEHLKAKYPFLFSLVLRTHPFQERKSAIVT